MAVLFIVKFLFFQKPHILIRVKTGRKGELISGVRPHRKKEEGRRWSVQVQVQVQV